jgi:hypothetical protein
MGTGALDNKLQVAYFEYDFARDGGAIGDITLRGNSLPAYAIVIGGMIDVEVAVTSADAATIALNLEAAADVLAITGKASFSLAALLDVVPVNTAATAVRLTAIRKLVATVADFALTAGKFTVALTYILPRD